MQADRAQNLLALVTALALAACDATPGAEGPDAGSPIDDAGGATLLSLQKEGVTALGPGNRPEIEVTDQGVFVVYLRAVAMESWFSVKILDVEGLVQRAEMDLVATTTEHGKPTDIRMERDGDGAWLFYETVTSSRAYLWGALHALDDGFVRLAQTAEPIASGPIFTQARDGDELVNDPIPLVGPDGVFVLTRLEQASFCPGEETVYRVYQITRAGDVLGSQRVCDLDLSGFVQGAARQTSARYANGKYYLISPSTVTSTACEEAMATLSDLVLLSFDPLTCAVRQERLLSQDPNDVETFVTGFEEHNAHFFVTYDQIIRGPGTFSSVLKVFDGSFDLVYGPEVVEQATSMGDPPVKPVIAVTDRRAYVMQGARELEVYTYGLSWAP